MIRFKISQEGKDDVFSAWEDELVRAGMGPHTAVQRMSELRATYGKDAAISIERTTVLPDVDHRQVRFKIVEGKKTKYSKTFPIAEREERLTEMQEKFPKADVTEEVIGNE